MKYLTAIACIAALLTIRSIAIAQEVTDDFDDWYHVETFAVDINDVRVCDACSAFVSLDDTVYVSAADLDVWQLKRIKTPAFLRDGLRYYGLQTDLRLATSFDTKTHELEIVAPASAFRGQPPSSPNATPGRGSFVNYDLTRENGRYSIVAGGQGGVYEMRYLDTTANGGLEFHRAATHWFQINSHSHTILSLGEQNTSGGWLGVNAPFAGAHYATDFSADPLYVPRGAPSVSGVAEAPSLLEVYIDNILELRRDIPEGRFTVDDLPASAANADIVMVLTDKNGAKTVQVARPQFDASFLGRGFSDFRADAGIGHENADLRNQFYRGFVASSQLRYGITDRITAEVYGESVNGETFADAGADVFFSPGNTFGFRSGSGNQRRGSEYRYEYARGIVRLRETYTFNSETTQPIYGTDFAGAVEQISERSDLDLNLSSLWTVGLGFNRSRSNNGSDQSAVSGRISYRPGPVDVSISPFYDILRHSSSANLSVNFRLSHNQGVALDSAISSQAATSGALAWQRSPASPNDPVTARVKWSASQSQDQRVELAADLPWAAANFDWQQQYGRNLWEPRIAGALAFTPTGVDAMRQIGSSESFGVLNAPGLRFARVKVNSSEAGRLNGRGRSVMRNLSTYRLNEVELSTTDLPIWANVLEPVRIIPANLSPVNVTISIFSRGGFTLNAVDAAGKPLAPGSTLVDTKKRMFPVGYDGRVYVTGIGNGPQRLQGTTSAGPCNLDVIVPPNVDDIPNLGTFTCR